MNRIAQQVFRDALKNIRNAALAGLFFAALFGGMETAAWGAELIKIDGSSTVYPITEAVAEEFQKKSPKIHVTIGVSGTGGGFKKFCTGKIDISNASRPIKPSETDLCKENRIKYVELPVAYDGLVVVVNPKNTWATHMTVKELKKLWEPQAQHKIKKWSHIRTGWPDKEIHLFGPGVDSGTYDYFTESIVGEEHASRGDFTASEDDNILVQGISTDPLALGFFGMAYFEYNKDKLKLVGIDDEKVENGNGPVLATYETVVGGTYQPLARPLFIYVSTKAMVRPEIREFMKFYLDVGRRLVKEVGYVALPDRVYDLALQRFDKQVIGSVFGGKGSKVGIRLESLLAAEAP